MPGTTSRSSCGRATAAPAALLVLGLALGCGTLSVPEEQALGRQMSSEIRRGVVFLPDRVVERYVRDIGEDILRAAGPQPFEYRFFVIEDDDINAFAAPAGYIYIHTQTILAASNVSELAGVIAPEIGHVTRRHIAQNYNRQRNIGIGTQAAVLAASIFGGGAAATAASLGGGLAATAYLNSFGRAAGPDARPRPVGTSPRAGCDPNGRVPASETTRQKSGDRPADSLSTHPATADRAKAAPKLIDAQPPVEHLKVHDNGRLEIIQ